ncbi:SRPBCC domain-containing protein [Desmospora profundinema]|uniref:Uncharacterized protein YndB with AHSA1/START domain n=1 Tax=Desmospora profundinema TaxID=1571184 RepID=A0ABU1IH32_9BACL|nr:SRPBCC domain-containing protein [Desmospora profundinema]MDR6224081.1 uncharacterized protein YndB with AHSA1/START domain [Desmospora profundinema]
MSHNDKTNEVPYVITRTFDAPRKLVFKAFTESEHLQHWWGPKGWTLEISEFDFRPGGAFHYSQRSADGQKMWGKFVYREIGEPEKLIYTSSFSDEAGNTVRAPFSQTWPLEILNTLTFTEQEDKTILTMHMAPLSATEEERKTFEAMRPQVQQGFAGTLDQLAAYLSKAN